MVFDDRGCEDVGPEWEVKCLPDVASLMVTAVRSALVSIASYISLYIESTTVQILRKP